MKIALTISRYEGRVHKYGLVVPVASFVGFGNTNLPKNEAPEAMLDFLFGRSFIQKHGYNGWADGEYEP